ncbi:DedA family protein [Nocardioides daphniae]|nr:VTT domain-containing protein [Nocardioides daphniae]
MSPLHHLQSVMLEPMLFGMKWMDPEWLLSQFGAELFWLSLLIIFVECGLFFPFLPGDSLLFAMGIFLAHPDTGIDIFPGPVWLELVIGMALFVVAGFGGNVAGYEIGRKIGPPLYERDGKVLKRKYFDQTTAFFDKHGNKALVIGRFVPFVRTYITVVAGVTQMDRGRFFKWSMVGAVAWVVSITLLGALLGTVFPALGENIDYAIFAIIAFSLIPMAWEWVRHRRTNAPGAEIGPQDGGPDRDIMGQDVDGERRHRH